MEGRKKRIAILLTVAAAFAAVVAGTAGARVDTKSAGTLDIYGYGPGDDVQENRATYAAGQLSGTTIKREPSSFDDQAFLTRDLSVDGASSLRGVEGGGATLVIAAVIGLVIFSGVRGKASASSRAPLAPRRWPWIALVALTGIL